MKRKEILLLLLDAASDTSTQDGLEIGYMEVNQLLAVASAVEKGAGRKNEAVYEIAKRALNCAVVAHGEENDTEIQTELRGLVALLATAPEQQ